MGTDTSARNRPPLLIRLFVLAGFAVFAGTMAVIYYEYVTIAQPDCMVLVYGNRNLEKTIAVVQHVPSAEALSEQEYRAVLNESNRFCARFFLTSGTYHLRLLKPNGDPVALADGRSVLDATTSIPRGFRQQYDVGQLFPLEATTTISQTPPTR
jgi:hypothetical protein